MQWRNLKGNLLTSYNKRTSSQKANGVNSLDTVFKYKAVSAWDFPVFDSFSGGTMWAWGNDAWTTNGTAYQYKAFALTNSGALNATSQATGVSSPVQVGVATNWLQVTSGNHCGLAIKTDGTLWAWGRNTFGSNTIGTGGAPSLYARSTYMPTQVGALTNWSKVVTGVSYSTFAIKTDGTLWAWGYNAQGQLGLGNTTNYSSPKQVGLLTNWRDVFPGKKRTFAIKTDGTLWSWGYNIFGQLGLGNTTNYSSPKQVGSRTDWKQISNISSYLTIGLTNDGSMWFWGKNESSISIPNVAQYSPLFTSPILLSGSDKWLKMVSLSGSRSPSAPLNLAAIKTDGTLWVWGPRSYIMASFGSYGSSSSPAATISPVLVDSSKNWVDVAITTYSGAILSAIAAIKNDGTLWTWGQGSMGKLALNNVISYSSPKQVGSATNWRRISGQGHHFFALRS